MNKTPWAKLPDWVSHSEHWFVLSDTHGRIGPFKKLLAAAPDGAKLIHLGDICDRGPASLECFKEIAVRPDMVLIMGNHDMFAKKVMFELEPINNEYCQWKSLWFLNGGYSTAEEMSANPESKHLVKGVLDRQILYNFDGNLFFVHSGLLPWDNFKELAQKNDISAWDIREDKLMHLTWRADNDPRFWEQDENASWKGFPVKPFFVHGHRRCSRTHAKQYTKRFEKTAFRPREDSWRLGVDARIGMSALEILNGQYRFYDIDDAPYE